MRYVSTSSGMRPLGEWPQPSDGKAVRCVLRCLPFMDLYDHTRVKAEMTPLATKIVLGVL
jgi:hypothetical protein